MYVLSYGLVAKKGYGSTFMQTLAMASSNRSKQLSCLKVDQFVGPTIMRCAVLSCAAYALCTRLQAALNARTGEHKQCCMGFFLSWVLSLYLVGV